MNDQEIKKMLEEALKIQKEETTKAAMAAAAIAIDKAIELEREKVAAWMRSKSYATGHGDTVEDLLKEMEWQVAEREREACAKLAGPHLNGEIAAAIRARGET